MIDVVRTVTNINLDYHKRQNLAVVSGKRKKNRPSTFVALS